MNNKLLFNSNNVKGYLFAAEVEGRTEIEEEGIESSFGVGIGQLGYFLCCPQLTVVSIKSR